MRRTVLTIVTTLIAVLALGAAVVAANGSDTSTVTRARLEHSLPATFANLYVERARLQGRTGLTPASLSAQAMCDKGGAAGQDVGPGGDWVCLMSWTDPELPMPAEGYGKFELNVHSNDCYTVTSPSKLIGFLTLNDNQGQEVINPVFEFDGCFDPHGDNSPTGVAFPSLLAVTSTNLSPDPQGRVGLQLSCGAGEKGCAGTVSATAGNGKVATLPFDLQEQSTATLPLPDPLSPSATDVRITVTLRTGVGPSSPVNIPVQGP